MSDENKIEIGDNIAWLICVFLMLTTIVILFKC